MNRLSSVRFATAVFCFNVLQFAAASPSPGTYFPGQLAVKFKPSRTGLAAAPQLAGAQIKFTMPRLGWQVIQLPPGVEVADALEYYRQLPDVAYAEPNYRIHLFKSPNDPRWDALWSLKKIDAPAAWDQTTGDPDLVVATLDTGVDYNHPDLAANIWTNPGEIADNTRDDDANGYVDDLHGFNTLNHNGNVADDDGHGTHVAGIIGALGDNGLGVAGINWRVKIIAVKIFNADDSAGTAGAAAGYDYLLALKQRGVNIRVINNSWGGPMASRALAEAFRAAEAAGMLSVCAAGNSHHDTGDRPEYPAGIDCESLISVAASTPDDDVATYSNYGATTVDLAAPGDNVLSTYRGAHYQELSGTSMASPHVAGAAALLFAQNAALTPAQVKALLMATVDPLPQWQGRVRSGGRLNLGRAMARLVAGPLPILTTETNDLALPLPRIRAVSRDAQGRWGTGSSLFPSISTNGQWVAFLSVATNLTAEVSGTNQLVYLCDRAARTNLLVSRSAAGVLPNADCADVHLSGNGEFVVFSSSAGNLVANDNNNASDVFLYDRQAGQLELISKAGTSAANGASDSPAVSDDGRYVVFASDASNLVAGDSNGYRDIFVRDRQSSTTTRVSLSTGGTQADYTSDLPSISGDGRYLTFLSGADNLVADAYFPAYHLYLRDRIGKTTARVSKSAGNVAGRGNCGSSSLSTDGRYIAFESAATNLVSGDTNGKQDIFLKDRVAGSLVRISLANSGAQANDDCWRPFITANGRQVFFYSGAATLRAQDDDNVFDVFAYDRLTKKLSRLTYNQAGHPGLDNSFLPSASGDGGTVAFASWAWNLAPGDGTGAIEVLALERGDAIPDLIIYANGDTNRYGAGLHGTNIVQRRQLALTNNAATFFIRLDNDGPSNEVFSVQANASPPGWDATFLFGTTNVSAAITGAGWPCLVPAGSNVLLRLDARSVDAGSGESWAEWLVVAGGTRTNTALDAVRAVATRTPSPPALQIVSRAADGRLGNDDSGPVSVSSDARFVAFTSMASDLTPKDYNLQEDVFVLDRQTQSLECLSEDFSGQTGNGRSYSPRLSRDGRYVVFRSAATNLVTGDSNGRDDIFLADRQTHTLSRVSVGPSNVQSLRDSGNPHLSGDGRYVAFESLAENFTAPDNNHTWDIFLRDTVAGTTTCLSLVNGETANDESHSPVISMDGSLVVFASLASNLVPNDTNGVYDLFLWQRGINALKLLSRTVDGRPGNDYSEGASISDDNRYILFSSLATDLAVQHGDTNSIVFLFDRQTDQLSQINPPRLAGRQRHSFYGARLSPDGRFITLLADVAALAGGSNYVTGVFLYDRSDATLTELTRKPDGTPGNDTSDGAVVSADGRYVALTSRAPNLLGETTLSTDQVLLYDRAKFQPDAWIQRGTNAPPRGQESFSPTIQWTEQTIKFNFTNELFVSIRNRGNFADGFLFRGPLNVPGGLNARYYLQPGGTEITAAATNAGWVSDQVAVGDSREIRILIVASNTNLFNQDLVFTSTSLTDPTRVDTVRLRLLRDDDRDGLPDAWEQQYLANRTNALASADPDGDGFSNLQEYIAGTDPTSALSELRITTIQMQPDGSVTVSWPSVTNRFYTVERAVGEPTGFVPLWGSFGASPNSSYVDSVRTNSAPVFYRVRVELP